MNIDLSIFNGKDNNNTHTVDTVGGEALLPSTSTTPAMASTAITTAQQPLLLPSSTATTTLAPTTNNINTTTMNTNISTQVNFVNDATQTFLKEDYIGHKINNPALILASQTQTQTQPQVQMQNNIITPGYTSDVSYSKMSLTDIGYALASCPEVVASMPVSSQTPLGSPATFHCWDMSSLKNALCLAKSGTGQVCEIVKNCVFIPREQAFTSLIKFCGSLGEWQKAIELFEAMRFVPNVKPNTYTYSALIAACSTSGQWYKAIEVYEIMKIACQTDPECLPNKVTFCAVISACEKGGMYKKALEVFQEMLLAGINADEWSLRAALSSCQKSGNWSFAQQILLSVKGSASDMALPPVILSSLKNDDWKHAINVWLASKNFSSSSCTNDSTGMAAHFKFQNNNFKMASVNATTPTSGTAATHVPHLNSFANNLNQLTSHQKNAIYNTTSASTTAQGLNFTLPMTTNNVNITNTVNTVNLTSGNTQLSSTSGSSPEQFDFENMSRYQLSMEKPAWDMDTLKRLICMAKTGTGEVRRVIETCTFLPRAQAFTTLINMCGRMRDWLKACEIFEAMKSVRGVQPNTYTYSALIAACSTSGEWERALNVFNMMKAEAKIDSGCTPNEVTYSTVITACQRGGLVEQAVMLYEEMIDHGLIPDQGSFNSILAACERNEKWEMAEKILSDMHKQGLTGNPSIYCELIEVYGKKQEWSKIVDLYNELKLVSAGQPEEAIRQEVMKTLEKGGQHHTILEIFSDLFRKSSDCSVNIDMLSIASRSSIINRASIDTDDDYVFGSGLPLVVKESLDSLGLNLDSQDASTIDR